MFKATLTLKGMLGVPASPTVTTVAGMTQASLILTGTRPAGTTVAGQKPTGLTITAPLDLTVWGGS